MRITKETKSKPKQIPEGATIIKREKSVEVEEIENGFLIIKRFEIEYETENGRDWTWETKKYYSETDPLTINTNNQELADIFQA